MKTCNPHVRRFIPPVVNLRAPMFLAGFLAASLSGQTPTNTSSAAISPGGDRAAASGGAVVLSQTAAGSPVQTGASSARRNAHGRNGHASAAGVHRGGGASSQPPAPAANGDVQVIGFPASNTPGTVDRPLLPIASTGNGLGIASGTPIRVRLGAAVDSGHAHNGDMVEGTLAEPIGNLPAGTPVRLTVVQAAAAGTISSYGQLSLQVVSIADRRVLSNVITALGKEGAKELPDAAPTRGTEAVFSPDQPISLPAA